ncbi:MAG: hypothetical protein ACJ8E1_17640, partial [Xanthobacteraceae bacterium]
LFAPVPIMPITHEPKPLPSPIDYVPNQSTPYRVKSGDSWWTLAEQPQVRAVAMSALDLCYFNFKTRRPPEINWYLRNKVGCRTATKDGKNYTFSASDYPGVIYLPIPASKPPVNEYPQPDPSDRTNAWIGIGGKAGTQFIVVGIETLVGYVASLDDLGKGMAIGASINRLGPGFGASGGFCIIYITGVKNPSQLNGHQQGDWDANLALGPKWSNIAKGGKNATKLKPLIDALRRLGASTPGGLKALLKKNPDKWLDLIKTARTMKDFIGIDPNGEPNVLLIDVPISGGAEASVFFGVANYEAMWDFTE